MAAGKGQGLMMMGGVCMYFGGHSLQEHMLVCMCSFLFACSTRVMVTQEDVHPDNDDSVGHAVCVNMVHILSVKTN